MRYKNSSGVRASVGAVAAALVTAVTVFLFESPYTAWGTRTQPAVEVALSVPAADAGVRNS